MAKLAPYAVRWGLKHTLPAANEVGELFAALDAAYTKFGQLIASSSFTLLSFIFYLLSFPKNIWKNLSND